MRAVIALVAGGGAVCTAFGAPVGPAIDSKGPVASSGSGPWSASVHASQPGFENPGVRMVHVTLADWLSDTHLGHAGNSSATIDLHTLLGSKPGGALAITGIAWNLQIETFGSSQLADATLQIHDAAALANGVAVAPGSAALGGGSGAFTSGSIVGLGDLFSLTRIVLSSGLLRLETFEQFDDVLGADAAWNGTITFAISQAAPAPTAGLAGLGGLAGLAALRRRR